MEPDLPPMPPEKRPQDPTMERRRISRHDAQMPAKHASGRVSSNANQMSPPSALLNSLSELNGTTQRFLRPSHLVQC
ncbi:hypothetical protein ABIE89_005983 [Bradyrhizobium niftali]